MKKWFVVVAFVVVWVAGCASVGMRSDGTIQPRLDLKEGQAFHGSVTQVQNITMTMMGMTIEQSRTSEFLVTLRVKSVAGGEAEVEYTFDDASMSSTTRMPEMDNNVQDNAADKIFEALKGFTFTVVLRSNGEVVRVEGGDRMVDVLVDAIPGQDPASRAMLAKEMRKVMSDETLRDMMLPSMSVYPDQAVRVGESWAKTFDVKAGFPHRANHTITLSQVEKNMAKLNGRSEIVPLEGGSTMEFLGMKLTMEMKGLETYEASMDLRTGMVMHLEGTGEMDGRMMINFDNMDEKTKAQMGGAQDPWAALLAGGMPLHVKIHQVFTLKKGERKSQ
ncbi:MAG: DUF6263 family protein [Candidatus Lernaella stagnicola]|nr:DUF6263 family protein [Candidatus Lernaella stagnicola]